MAAYRVGFVERALAEIAMIARWWRKNRLAAPKLFEDELDAALVTLSEQPEIGPRAKLRNHPGGRFYVLRRSGYVVFYLVDAEQREVTIVRARHVRRRPLRRPRRR